MLGCGAPPLTTLSGQPARLLSRRPPRFFSFSLFLSFRPVSFGAPGFSGVCGSLQDLTKPPRPSCNFPHAPEAEGRGGRGSAWDSAQRRAKRQAGPRVLPESGSQTFPGKPHARALPPRTPRCLAKGGPGAWRGVANPTAANPRGELVGGWGTRGGAWFDHLSRSAGPIPTREANRTPTWPR